MKEWDNRVQFSPKFLNHISDMLEGSDNPEAIRIYQDDSGYTDPKAGEIAFVWTVDKKSEDTNK